MILDATLGGEDSNSYCTVEEATLILEGRLNTEPWYVWSPTLAFQTLGTRRQAALVQATRLLDSQVAWTGEPTFATQALAWPQTGQVDAQGREVDPETIPPAIAEATALYALALLRDTSEAPGRSGESALKSKKLGDTTLVYKDTPTTTTTRAQGIPTEVRQLLKPYGLICSHVQIPLYRT